MKLQTGNLSTLSVSPWGFSLLGLISEWGFDVLLLVGNQKKRYQLAKGATMDDQKTTKVLNKGSTVTDPALSKTTSSSRIQITTSEETSLLSTVNASCPRLNKTEFFSLGPRWCAEALKVGAIFVHNVKVTLQLNRGNFFE